ncbi:vWA domain-containing protein [Desulfovirgula thermocuniculi]|uniref:vWA domain-containing protein n=1 Tax=Desulfovirgula thermocuniculi TaxID=348842 RepID=UPI0012EB92E1|nr:VWA domain-containing protein [Desulfovirgula thermocuniculi]
MPETLEENLVRFIHYLRRLGLKVGTAEALDALCALKEVNLLAREEVEAALKAVLAKSPCEQEIFKAAFAQFFAPPEEKRRREEAAAVRREREERALDLAREELARALSPWQTGRMPDAEGIRTFARMPPQERARLMEIIGRMRGNPVNDPGRLIAQVMQSALNYWRYHLLKTRGARGREELEAELDGEGGWPEGIPAEFYRDPQERLLHQDLQEVAGEDLEAVSRLIQRLSARLARRLSNRYRRSRRKKFLDMRRTIRQNLAHGGAPLELRYRSRRRKLPCLLLICDVSASMARYARFILQFMYGFGRAVKNFEVLIFSEDLERVTPHFNGGDFASVMAEVMNRSSQWGKTTNFYAALLTFQRHYSHLAGPETTVVVVSDTKTLAPREAAREVAKLRRQVREILWLNPVPKELWDHLPGVAAFAPHVKMKECRSLYHLEAIIRQWER